MRRGWARLATVLVIAVSVVSVPLNAQVIRFRFQGIDMYGSVVLPDNSDAGVAFGTRVNLAELFAGSLAMGLEIDWWTAGRSGVNLDVRNIIGGFSIWRELVAGQLVRPYLGLGAAVNSVDAVRADSPLLTSAEVCAFESVNGYKLGASGFAGRTL